MRHRRSVSLLLLLGLLAGCAADAGSPPRGRLEDEWFSEAGKGDTPQPALPLALTRIASAERFERLAFESEGTLSLGRSVKFLIDDRDPAAPAIYFMNARYQEHGATPDSARYHFAFAEAILRGFSEDLASFNRVTYDVQDKRYFAGTIQLYHVGEDGAEPLYGVQFYPQDVIHEERVVEALRIVSGAFDVPGARMAFVAAGPQQTTVTVQDDLARLGFEDTTVERLLGSLRYVPMQLGEAWGHLRIFPESQDTLRPTDIVVFDELPLDLTVVAGVVTRAFQDASCHINLKSAERGTPDMVYRDASPTTGRLAAFADQPVHLVVGADDFTIEPTTDDEIERRYRERTDRPWVSLPVVPETALPSYAELCPSGPAECLAANDRYGSKAANLGFLTSPEVLGRAADAGSPSARLGYDLVPQGFAVPIQAYLELVAHAPNAELRAALAELVDREKAGQLSPAERGGLLEQVQSLFYRAEAPPGFLERLRAAAERSMPGVRRIKVRSSANAEDIPGFDGAGLYDSFSANLRTAEPADGVCRRVVDADGELDMEPNSLGCAVRGAYASLWNRRAIEERSFARLDHAGAAMGLAVVARYSNESAVAANAVVVTRVLGAGGVYGYTLSTQLGNAVVTNPPPGTLAENVVAAFVEADQEPTWIVTRYATPGPGSPPRTTTIMTAEQRLTVVDLVRAIETAYCRYSPDYYGGSCRWVTVDRDKPSALDLELKLLENGQLVVKQVREFHGR